ncbi:hypothetical protein [Silvimonas iriomotensis]|uniref:Phosphoglycerate mutase n=1 Tax=Silvimonas iriomotensis TaxID=449662 RepID=A0ABQ2P691_9NEIS|nr:hypothetical protein [Silvimonas iriomotensis]GGP19185.1 hypothetical protein GCM10010970_09360 [Silvimonas iriomotensis]
MRYHLVIPHGIWPDAELQSHLVNDLKLPALGQMLGRGRPMPARAQSWHDWLAERFEVPGLPVAPLSMGVDLPDAEPGYWLRADPVHLHVGRDQLSLQDGHSFPITQADADALVHSLNQLFGEDGYHFVAATPQRWYLRVPQDPQLVCTPVDTVNGRNIDPFLPKGPDALLWHRALNEIQMLFYTHLVNDAREARGEPAISSVWFWGGGQWPLSHAPVLPAARIVANDPLVQALSGAARAQAEPLPGRVEDLPTQDAMIVFTALGAELVANDPQGWRDAWQKLEATWFSPLLESLKAGRIDSLAFSLPEAGLAVEVDRSLRWKFWRGPRLPWQF